MVHTAQLDSRYLDKPDSDYCPGFDLWDVLASDGVHYLMAGDYIGGVEVRLFFRAELEIVSAENLGRNPAADLWQSARA